MDQDTTVSETKVMDCRTRDKEHTERRIKLVQAIVRTSAPGNSETRNNLRNLALGFWHLFHFITIMPLGLFGNKFTPKKTPPRRAQSLSNLNLDAEQSRAEFGVDYSGVRLNLGGQEVAFENGLWVAESGTGLGGGSQREMLRLKKTNQQLHEENNLLKLKVDILLDMLAEISAVSHFHENELKQLREAKSKRK